jgi:hypothetical protein
LRTPQRGVFFGDDCSESCTINSITEIIKHISKADYENVLAGECTPETDKCEHAENNVVDFLKCLRHAFVKAAARGVLKQSQTDEFQHGVLADAKRNICQATQEIVEAESTVEVEALKQNLGKIIDAVNRLSEATPPDEDEGAAGERNTLMRGQFMDKLIRMQWRQRKCAH